MHAGATLGRRFTLLRQVDHDLAGVERWVARDTRLAAIVHVDIITSLAPTAVRQSAARSAQVRDARLARVISSGRHTDGEDRVAYLVSERPEGTRLDELLVARVMPAPEALSLVGEAARALRVAAGAGVHHGHLRPSALTISPGGRVIISGLGADGELATQAGVGRGRTEAADAAGLARLLVLCLTGRDVDTATAADVPVSLPHGARDLCLSAIAGDGPHRLDDVIAAAGPPDPRVLRGLRARMGTWDLTPDERARRREAREEQRRRRMDAIRPDSIAAAAARADAVVAAAHASPALAEDIARERVTTGEIPLVMPGAAPERASAAKAEEDSLAEWEELVEDQNSGEAPSVWEAVVTRVHRRWPSSATLTAVAEQAHERAQRTGPINAGPLVIAGFTVVIVIAVFVAIGLMRQPFEPEFPRYNNPPNVYPELPAEPTPTATPDGDG